MRAYSGPDDSPPMRMVAGLLRVSEALEAQMKSMEARPVADIERAVRQSLGGLRPHFEKRWRWQRWSTAIMAGAVAAAAIGAVMYHVGRDVGGTDSARWTEWCAVPEHVSRLPGETYCKVPVTADGTDHR